MCRPIPLLVLAIAASAPAAAVEKTAVWPTEMPEGGSYTPGVLVGDTLYVAGQLGRDFKTGQYPEAFEAEVKQCLDNVGLVLRAGGMDFDDVVSVQVFLTDVELFKAMNDVYRAYFSKKPLPARTTTGASRLPGGKGRIEIAVTARK